ncbi:hypothetical protein GCM10010987_63320 [Bradyrhizobium guangdongense]|uniref:Transcriptional regulator AbiEi antitoxin N-terminal domain-containing protein n=1 Tax=Bradyrhizobium guangdongense TaxID=1325090 RepID=A0AA88BBP9_9BRAD|nr:hypothetical protein GCM10010987_63320 [Bradyrhizobium guangdongense]
MKNESRDVRRAQAPHLPDEKEPGLKIAPVAIIEIAGDDHESNLSVDRLGDKVLEGCSGRRSDSFSRGTFLTAQTSDAPFGSQPVGVEDAAFSLSDNDNSELALSPWRWPIRMSSPERAILEMLDELPADESFQKVDTLFEGLVSLRPKLLNQLLEECRSIKVKRLFFIYADKHVHPWRKHIDTAHIELGRGDRSLVQGGRLHPTCRMTVPAELVPQETVDGA